MSANAVQLPEIGDYSLLRSLGRGPQGTVYLGLAPERLGLGRREIAIKVLASPASDSDFDRVTEELLAYAAADSTHLVKVFEAGHTDDGTVYFSREHAVRGTLDSSDEPPATDTVLDAVACAARGADALHEVGVAHRAIKPENVLLLDDGAKLADLDLRHLLAPGQTVSGHTSGHSIQCLAPELVRGEEASRASDVWALGVTLHVALTGRGIYAGGVAEHDAVALTALRAIMAGARPEIDESLPSALAQLIEECVALDACARPPTAAAVAQRIEAARSR